MADEAVHGGKSPREYVVAQARSCHHCHSTEAKQCLLQCPKCENWFCDNLNDDQSSLESMECDAACSVVRCKFCQKIRACRTCAQQACSDCGQVATHCDDVVCKQARCATAVNERKEASDGMKCSYCMNRNIYSLIECHGCKKMYCNGEYDDQTKKPSDAQCFLVYCQCCKLQVGCYNCHQDGRSKGLFDGCKTHCEKPHCIETVCKRISPSKPVAAKKSLLDKITSLKLMWSKIKDSFLFLWKNGVFQHHPSSSLFSDMKKKDGDTSPLYILFINVYRKDC